MLWRRALLVATAINLWLIVTSTTVAALLRRIASVIALGLVGLVWRLEGAFAGLRVNKDIALIALVPF